MDLHPLKTGYSEYPMSACIKKVFANLHDISGPFLIGHTDSRWHGIETEMEKKIKGSSSPSIDLNKNLQPIFRFHPSIIPNLCPCFLSSTSPWSTPYLTVQDSKNRLWKSTYKDMPCQESKT